MNTKHLSELVKSIKKKNLLKDNPIIINSAFGVIDGQHRLIAAQQLNVPIAYLVSDPASIEEVHLLNAHMWPWTMTDYLLSYKNKGLADYATLQDFAKRFELNLSISIGLLQGGVHRKKEANQLFKDGKFVITHLSEAQAMAENLQRIKPLTEGDCWRTREFIGALRQIYGKGATPDDFYRRLINWVEHKGKLRKRVYLRDYIRDFEDVFNYGRKKNLARFW